MTFWEEYRWNLGSSLAIIGVLSWITLVLAFALPTTLGVLSMIITLCWLPAVLIAELVFTYLMRKNRQ